MTRESSTSESRSSAQSAKPAQASKTRKTSPPVRGKARPRKAFQPWKRDLQRSFGLAVCAVLALYLAHAEPIFSSTSRHIQLTVYALSGLALWASLHLLRRALARRRGQRVEHQAAQELRGVLAKDVPIFETGVPIPPHAGGGDADVLVGDATRRWVVEVKSHVGVAVAKGWFGKARLVRSRGAAAFARNPFSQVLRNADYLKAQPVVWFPRARQASSGVINGVLVVTGPAWRLAKEADMPRSKGLFGF